ncbi:hypothetical protein HanIR_Chr09g0396621 [Helianthus annuus]|nr:hypothetical protein HanIR_Chr09g0396621 [Helianthus annuus]
MMCFAAPCPCIWAQLKWRGKGRPTPELFDQYWRICSFLIEIFGYAFDNHPKFDIGIKVTSCKHERSYARPLDRLVLAMRIQGLEKFNIENHDDEKKSKHNSFMKLWQPLLRLVVKIVIAESFLSEDLPKVNAFYSYE